MFVVNQSTRLLRTAHLLTGDRGRAEDLVRDSLVATYRQLSRVRDVRALDDCVSAIDPTSVNVRVFGSLAGEALLYPAQ